MKTKLFTILLAIIFSAPLVIAQTSISKTSFAILGGVNMQNMNGKGINGETLENEMIFGYHAGINIQLPIAPDFYFQPGLMFSTKGTKNAYGSLTGTYRLSYIELPLNVVYKAQLGNGYIMIGFGPYAGYGIMGTATLELGSATVESDIEFRKVVELSDPLFVPYFKAFDAGGNVFAGYETASGLFLQLNTQFGMVKINPEDRRITDDKSSVRNTGFGLSLGYRF